MIRNNYGTIDGYNNWSVYVAALRFPLAFGAQAEVILCGGLYETLRENEYLMEFRSERITRPPFILLTINVHAFTKIN